MLIGPGHPDWQRLVVGLYVDHPLSLLSRTTIERQIYLVDQSGHEWYSPELVQYYRHLSDDRDHDLEPCVWCNSGDARYLDQVYMVFAAYACYVPTLVTASPRPPL
jgi:hypothetical protein